MKNDLSESGGIEKRLRHRDDVMAIYQLVSAYGLGGDSGDAEPAADQWAGIGDYVIPEMATFKGRNTFAEMVENEIDQT